MTDKQYPPLPTKTKLGFDAEEGHEIMGYEDADLFDYVDADRAQRLQLTDEQCDRVAKLLNVWALERDCYELGLPLYDEEDMGHARSLIRAAINTPSRPDAGNTQE